jgi:hypothetical protein
LAGAAEQAAQPRAGDGDGDADRDGSNAEPGAERASERRLQQLRRRRVQAIQENKRLRRGKTDPVVLMSIVWNASADKVQQLQPPTGTSLESALADVHSALLSLKAKADDYQRGVFDIAYELEAFKQADLAARKICR